jgi:hypothetical protein
MDNNQLSLKIVTAVSKSLTPDAVSLLKADGIIATVKIVSAAFDGLSFTKRLDLTIEAIEGSNPALLTDYDLTFILVSPIENANWTDYKELNRKTKEDAEKVAAKEI